MRIIAEIPTRVQPSHSRNGRRPAARLTKGLAVLGLVLSLAACVYQVPIRQGNYLDPAAISQVKAGMTHSQVRFLLGTPMIPGGFDNQRWDYDYYLTLHRLQRPQRQHVTVYFEKDLVARVQSDVTSAPVTSVRRGGINFPVPY